MDARIVLQGIPARGRHGANPGETDAPQSFAIDLDVWVDVEGDDLEQTVDYRLAGDMIDAVQGREYLLIERVAEELAEVALRNPLVHHVTVSVKKRPPVQGLEWAGVRITRGR